MWHIARSRHPFAMHDGIMAEPDTFNRVFSRTSLRASEFAKRLKDAREILLVGAGSSYFAAEFGKYLAWETFSESRVRVVSSFDFVEYFPQVAASSAGIFISHRGNELYTSKALLKFAVQNRLSAYVVGENARLPDVTHTGCVVFETTPQEASPAHTWSLVGSMAAVAGIFNESFGPGPISRDFLDTFTTALGAAHLLESEMKGLAEEVKQSRKIWLVGAGFSGVVAKEIALKIKETSYLTAQGYDLEEVIQGPLQGAEPNDVFILIVADAKGHERFASLSAALAPIGARVHIICVPKLTETFLLNSHATKSTLELCPTILPPFTGLSALIPLQFFAYYLALACGRHPDSFRLDDPRFAASREKLKG